MESNNIIGRFAVSGAGHDKGTLYVIVACDESISSVWNGATRSADIVRGTGQVYLCDGRYHTLDKPKKKSMKHIELQQESIAEGCKVRLVNKEKIFDHEIKYAIKMQQKGKEEGYVKE